LRRIGDQEADPGVIIAEFEYQGNDTGTGEPYALPAIFVLRVRNGGIVSARDYYDHHCGPDPRPAWRARRRPQPADRRPGQARNGQLTGSGRRSGGRYLPLTPAVQPPAPRGCSSPQLSWNGPGPDALCR
jgi:hypothetical protein